LAVALSGIEHRREARIRQRLYRNVPSDSIGEMCQKLKSAECNEDMLEILLAQDEVLSVMKRLQKQGQIGQNKPVNYTSWDESNLEEFDLGESDVR